MTRPITTLFLLTSVDGKITLGTNDALDFDKDLPKIKGAAEGLQQYYEIEQTTDLWSLNSGRVQEKIGVNEAELPKKSAVSFVIIDNSHLLEHGLRYFAALARTFVLVTSNPQHPAFALAKTEKNLHIIFQEHFDAREMLRKLATDFSCERLTIQTGGTLNGFFLREKLIDYIDLIVAPILVGGKETTTIIDGTALTSVDELGRIGVLELENCQKLKNSYLRLRYKVIK